ncbi:MAG: Hsp33 family molecular chaperone HslO [Gammaproteobacteria bacterium]|nr:Hsp33 family molecular chaperone HslO [Gammaproteobacteria bacterium]
MNNSIQRFLFKDLNIRGQVVRLEEAWQSMTTDRHYPKAIIELLGELSGFAVIMATGMKHAGKITLQIQGSGPITLLVVEVSHDLKIRGVAKTNQPIDEQTDLDSLLGDGRIMVTLDNSVTKRHFQSFVDRQGETISEVCANFLSQSEQLPSKMWLSANEHAMGGVLIQKLADTDDIDADGWDRVHSLTNTLKDEELTTLDAETLLHRLFHEEVIELFEAKEVVYECPKDSSKVEAMLLSLGEAEVRKILKEEGEIVVHNEICNFHLRFGEKEVDELFTEAADTSIQ